MMQRSGLVVSALSRFGASSSRLSVAPRLALTYRAASTASASHTESKPATQASSQWKLYHLSSYALLGLIPTGLIVAPSPVALPIDLALNVIIPYHMYFGLVAVLNDYVYSPSSRYVSKAVIIVLSVLTALGLSKLNLKDVGISQGIKLMWKDATAHNKK